MTERKTTAARAIAAVTKEWLQLASEAPEWRTERYPLAERMIKRQMTPWQAASDFAPHDPLKRTVRQLHRIATDVMEVLVEEFLDPDPVLGWIETIKREGQACVPMIYCPRMKAILENREIPVETEEAQIFYRT